MNVQSYTVKGKNFPTDSTVETATLGGINSNSAVINSPSQITLTFTNGIGFGTDLPLSALVFADGKHTTIDAAAKVTVALAVTMAQNVACSYAGGCLYSVTGDNVNKLASSLSTTVCGRPCVYDQAASTDDNTYKCRAPLLGTAYSAQTYLNLVPDTNWLTHHGTNGIELELVTSSGEFGKEAFDQDTSNNSGTLASCYIGQKVKSAGHKGMISKIRYFLPQTTEA